MKLDPYLTPCIKINSRWINDLYIKRQNFKTFRTNIGQYLYDIKINKVECKSNESLSSNVNIRQNKDQGIKDKEQKYMLENGKA